ncbi:MAG: hypothetical protein JW741_16940 [Sedimentisphaerales bacterium]|nr:hypothetical protein [Sedimentisphaerales bacterium]
MDERKLVTTLVWVSIGAIALSLLCLISNGAGDHPESFRMYLLCSSIVLGAALLALAISTKRKE